MLHKVLLGLLRNIYGVEMEMIDFDSDHLHMVVTPPKYAISDVMGKLKSQSLLRVKKKLSWLSRAYRKDILWSLGYFVTSVDIEEKVIIKLR